MKKRGLIGPITAGVAVLVTLQLFGFNTSSILMGLIGVGIVFVSLRWIFTGRPPTGKDLLLLGLMFFGPTLLLTMLQMGVARMRVWPHEQALLLLLTIGGLLFWLGRKWRR